MKILICNVGSTSLKYKLFQMEDEKVLLGGKIEKVGAPHPVQPFGGRASCGSPARWPFRISRRPFARWDWVLDKRSAWSETLPRSPGSASR
jgi:hypothetical protein